MTDRKPTPDGAYLSDDGNYRYLLWRQVGDSPPRSDFDVVTFVMLNPSTADASVNDPTILKCMNYARRWGYKRLDVVNLFAYRATDPTEMAMAEDPVGPSNRAHLYSVVDGRGKIICAWGNQVPNGHTAEAEFLLRACSTRAGGVKKLHCLRMNKNGSPAHPLYLPGDLDPIPYR